MSPPNGPDDALTPPPPPPTPPPAEPTETRPAIPVARRGPNALVLLAIGLIVGVGIGGAGGYFLFHGTSTTSSAGTTAHATPTPSPSSSPTPVATTPSTPTPALAQGVVPCPVAAPVTQHPLGNPAPPSGAMHADPSLDFCGRGTATIPTGTTRFTTNNNWGLGLADSCPQGSAGESGMNIVLTVSEVLLGGGAGPDTTTEPGDWVDSGGSLMPTGGNYQLKVTTIVPDCVWDIAIYTT